MSEYQVIRHQAGVVLREFDGIDERWSIGVAVDGRMVAAGRVDRAGEHYDVFTLAGAMCFKGTPAYDVRVAAVESYRQERAAMHRATAVGRLTAELVAADVTPDAIRAKLAEAYDLGRASRDGS